MFCIRLEPRFGASWIAFLSVLTWCQRLSEIIVYIIEWIIGYNHATVVTGRI